MCDKQKCKICFKDISRPYVKCKSSICKNHVHFKCLDSIPKLIYIEKKNWRCRECIEALKSVGNCVDFDSLNKENEHLKREIELLKERVEDLKTIQLLQERKIADVKNQGESFAIIMAHIYYHGYLKIILAQNNLKVFMEKYEGRENISFVLKKMFILIPKSLDCADSLELSSNNIECAKSLDDLELTRAAVKNRVYRNPVYKIKQNEKYNYVVAEYATPIKTYKEATQICGKYQTNFDCFKGDIAEEFYIKLSEILIENEIRDVELIYYADKDNGRKNIDLAKILLERIKLIKETEDIE